MPSPQQYQQQRINEQQQYQQQPVQQSMNVNEQMIRAIVKEELLNILGGEFTKQIRENAIKSTIQTLIKEGKVKTTTRKKQVRRD
jgi:signal recognition particle GTPase